MSLLHLSASRNYYLYNGSCEYLPIYTDQILNRGGPESFNGLPGMILGVGRQASPGTLPR